MDTLTLIAFTTVILLIIGGITAVNFARRQQSKRLQKQFDREYKRTVRQVGDKTEAEAELVGRMRHVKSLNLVPLTGEQTAQFATEWEALQDRFEREPLATTRETEHLIRRAMHAKGYPVESFDQFTEDMSVDYPDLVTSYRALRDIAARSKTENVSIEEMRRAMRGCETLVEEILEIQPVEKNYEKTG